jgi:hypothetical protein
MTEEEVKALLDTLIESFREFVAEEVQRLHNMGKTVSSAEIEAMLRAFEADHMTKLFNEERIPQDKFRIFLRDYLRLWFEMLASKIADADGKVIVVETIDDLPDDGSAVVAVVGGELYYFDGDSWEKACDCIAGRIPVYEDVADLPTGTEGANIAIVKAPVTGGPHVDAGLYFQDPDTGEWAEVISREKLDSAIAALSESVSKEIGGIYDNIANYVTNILEDNSIKDKGKTYHDAVLEIVDVQPAMDVGDRYLLTVKSEGGTNPVSVKEIETLHSVLNSKIGMAYYSGGCYVGNGVTLVGDKILSGNVASSAPEIMVSFVVFNSKPYCIGSSSGTLYTFDFQSKSYMPTIATLNRDYRSRKSHLLLFDGKLWFNAGEGSEVIWSYVDSGGSINYGDTFTVPDGKVFCFSGIEYLGKLHIFGDTGLWTVNTGATVPVHVDSLLFDSISTNAGSGGMSQAQVIFNGVLWVITDQNKIVSYNGSVSTEYNLSFSGVHSLVVWDGQLYAIQVNNAAVYRFDGSSFTLFKTLISAYCMFATVWDSKLWYLGHYRPDIDRPDDTKFALMTLELNGDLTVFYAGADKTGMGGFALTPEGDLIAIKESTGQMIVERHYYKTLAGGSSGDVLEIKIVGKDAGGEYEEPFDEGHRVVVKDSPTGFSREYGIRDGELTDTDGGDDQVQADWNQETDTAPDYIRNKPTIPPDRSSEITALQDDVTALKSITVIRGNVDTHAELLDIGTTDMRVGDSYVVEHDENNDNNSAIYTWDGTQWNFTHLWEINLNLKYGTYSVTSTPFTFVAFATKTENSEEFDVLEVSFDSPDASYSVIISGAAGNAGDTRIMIFNVQSGKTVSLAFGFQYKLVDGGELNLSEGIYVVTLLRASTNFINIAPYE